MNFLHKFYHKNHHNKFINQARWVDLDCIMDTCNYNRITNGDTLHDICVHKELLSFPWTNHYIQNISQTYHFAYQYSTFCQEINYCRKMTIIVLIILLVSWRTIAKTSCSNNKQFSTKKTAWIQAKIYRQFCRNYWSHIKRQLDAL